MKSFYDKRIETISISQEQKFKTTSFVLLFYESLYEKHLAYLIFHFLFCFVKAMLTKP